MHARHFQLNLSYFFSPEGQEKMVIAIHEPSINKILFPSCDETVFYGGCKHDRKNTFLISILRVSKICKEDLEKYGFRGKFISPIYQSSCVKRQVGLKS